MATVPYIIGNPYIDANFATLRTGTGFVNVTTFGASNITSYP